MNNKSLHIKKTVKDSIFTDIFKNKKYLLQLYQTLHPEDTDVTEDDLENITIKNVFTNAPYNDLGFKVSDKLIIMVEAQSTWSVNIVIRSFLYLAKTYQRYLREQKEYLYGQKAVRIPKPEIYVLYTGVKGLKTGIISLAEEFFGGDDSFLDLKAKVIYLDESGGIINQYIMFCKIYKDFYAIHGGNKERALKDTIRTCEDKNILREYLESKKGELIDMDFDVFTDEEIQEMYEHALREEGRIQGISEGKAEGKAEGRAEGKAEGTQAVARNMLSKGMDVNLISELTQLPIDEIQKLA